MSRSRTRHSCRFEGGAAGRRGARRARHNLKVCDPPALPVITREIRARQNRTNGRWVGDMIESSDHWWQNWPKTHGYVAEKMFFPSSLSDIALAIQAAERDRRPLRAVGG